MDNNVYISLSRQTALFRDLDVAANNIANANTTGYQAEKPMFSEFLTKNESKKDSYVNGLTTYRDTASGPIKLTGNPFDLAISGQGYFQVQTPQGNRYTKAGNFVLNQQGTMTTVNGYPVLGKSGGNITIPNGTKDVTINGAGQVLADGQQVGDVGVFEFDNQQAMKREGGTLYSSEEAGKPATQSRVAQGALEESNVKSVTELVRVQDLSRSVTNSTKFIGDVYDLQRKASQVYTKSNNG